MANFVRQYPSVEGNWLYHDDGNNRLFSDYIIRNENAEAWLECTQAEKDQYELEHPIENE